MSGRTSLLAAIVFILAVVVIGVIEVGFAGALFSVTFVIGLALWLPTTYRTPIDVRRIIGPYLTLVTLFVVQGYEEYATHVERTLARVAHNNVSQGQFLVVVCFAAPIIWLVGAVLMVRGWPFGWFLGCSLVSVMMFVEPIHFLAPFFSGGAPHYVSGLATSPFLVGCAWYIFVRMRREMASVKRDRAVVSGADGSLRS